MSNAYGKRGRWIKMLQNFNFKIIHCVGSKHTNDHALSRNPMGQANEDEDFQKEIHDCKWLQQDYTTEETCWICRKSLKMGLIL
jgi:hypothetical protein